MSHKDWKLKALTDIWTGDADRQGERLVPTGLMGSLRWWFEVLVRGLDGKACDPTTLVRCPDHAVKDPTKASHHCVVCELFGCTGWARKFRLMVLDTGGNIIQKQIAAGTEFTLRFIPLRPICDEEWCLLDCTLRIIADYGAIGGKTVLKPSDEPNRQNVLHHRDYGLIQYVSGPEHWDCEKNCDALKAYVDPSRPRWRKPSHTYRDERNQVHDFSWASLQNFWCVKGRYLARQDGKNSTFNVVVGRKTDKSEKERKGKRVIRWSDLLENPEDPVAVWLAGSQQESKKVFSFKHPQEGGRTFGFVNPGTVEENDIQTRLRNVWGSSFSLLRGDQILQSICNGAGGTQ
ncbi:hypothetical protein HRbin18_02019 [bacterium HR18]|nr:hypothetical protein HRbin18_02019 [bacterium HR18]